MKIALPTIGVLLAVFLVIGIYKNGFASSQEFSVCVTNLMKVDASCHKLEFDGADFSVGNMGTGGLGCIERIHGHKIPDVATITFSPILRKSGNESFTVKVDMANIPKDANGKIIFTIIDEKTVTVRYEPYSVKAAP